MFCDMTPLMNPYSFILALAGLASTALGADISDLVTAGERTYLRGDLAGAKEKFELVLRADPTNRLANSYLRRIVAEIAVQNAGKDPATGTRAALTRLVVPKVDFRDATLSSVLDFLKQKGDQLSQGSVAINFVLGIDEATQNTKITLTLNNAPFSEILRYIGELAGVQFVYEPYAIVVKPKGAGQAVTKNSAANEPEGGVKIPGL
jgi:hypothetical protein